MTILNSCAKWFVFVKFAGVGFYAGMEDMEL